MGSLIMMLCPSADTERHAVMYCHTEPASAAVLCRCLGLFALVCILRVAALYQRRHSQQVCVGCGLMRG